MYSCYTYWNLLHYLIHILLPSKLIWLPKYSYGGTIFQTKDIYTNSSADFEFMVGKKSFNGIDLEWGCAYKSVESTAIVVAPVYEWWF